MSSRATKSCAPHGGKTGSGNRQVDGGGRCGGLRGSYNKEEGGQLWRGEAVNVRRRDRFTSASGVAVMWWMAVVLVMNSESGEAHKGIFEEDK